MKSLVVALGAISIGAPANVLAASLPITAGVFYCGDGIEVSAEGIGGEDFFCKPADDPKDGVVTFICEWVDSDEPPETITATVFEDRQFRVVYYNEDASPVLLTPCPF